MCGMELFIRTHNQAVSRKFSVHGRTKSLAEKRLRRMFLRSRKRVVRYSLLSANLALLLVVIYFVAKTPSASQAINRDVSVGISGSETLAGPLDQVSSADIAVHVARTIGLPESNSVVNHADSVSAVEATAPADISVVAKPQLVSAALPSRKDIQSYTAVSGDTISSIATKFGVTSESIRGSNNLSGDRVIVGKVLVVPPKGTNGIVYSVKAGDTPDSLAQRFNANKEAIIAFNDAELGGLVVGEQILIPDGVAPAPVVFASSYNYASSAGFAWGGSRAVYSANGYDYGWCTWHAANRRREIGNPIPSNLGNAISWYNVAARNGMPVGAAPAAGAVLWHARMGGLGHVGFVEKINEDGSLQVSDMNYPTWGRATYRTVPPHEIGNYKFIY